MQTEIHSSTNLDINMGKQTDVNGLYYIYRKSAMLKMAGVQIFTIGLLLWYGLARLFELGIIGNQISPRARMLLPSNLLLLLLLIAALLFLSSEWMIKKKEDQLLSQQDFFSEENKAVCRELSETRLQRLKLCYRIAALGILSGILGFVIMAGYAESTKKMVLAGTGYLIFICGASFSYWIYEQSVFGSLHKITGRMESDVDDLKKSFIMKQAGVIFGAIAIAIFLYWGGRYLRWDICWISFPLMLILYGIVSAIIFGKED